MNVVVPEDRRRSSGGFTILEILIAIVILVLGISGIVALFPTAIAAGNQTVEDSYAAAITQSVIDAVSVGLRESRYTVQDTTGHVWTYFIFDHDGVYDQMSPTPQDYDSSFSDGTHSMTVGQADWCILLPQGKDPNPLPQLEPVFNYPSVRDFDNLGGGSAFVDHRTLKDLAGIPASPGSFDDWDPTRFQRPNYKGETVNYVRRVYNLGRYRKGQENRSKSPSQNLASPGPVRDEFLGEAQGTASATDSTQNRALVDPYPQYSFALSIRRSKVDNMNVAGLPIPDAIITKEDNYSSSLYEVRVLVFRNFDSGPALHQRLVTTPSAPIPRSNTWIREFVTLMSL